MADETCTTTITVAMSPTAMVPRLHGRAKHVPCDAPTVATENPGGRSSLTVTLLAVEGPVLPTTIV